MKRYYECVICDSINSVARFTCHCCGTIPARYSVLHKPSSIKGLGFTEVVKAHGSMPAAPTHAKIGLRTVRADYYAFD